MLTTRRLTVTAVAVLAALAIVAPAGHAGGTSSRMASDSTPPASPRQVWAQASGEGMRVTWSRGSPGSSAATHAIVDAGPGSCPVTVPALYGSALLPHSPGQVVVTPRVRLANELGVSAPASGPFALPIQPPADQRFVPLQVLSITDFHGSIEGSARSIGAALLTSAFDRDRQAVPATIAVSVGDNFGKSPLISGLFEEYPTVEAMNLMGIDVSTFGNHEHDRPLSHVRAMVESSDFTWTVSNYSDLTAVSGATKRVPPYVLLTRGGLTIGVVGMNMARTAASLPPGNFTYGAGQTLHISPSSAGASRAARLARMAGADVTVLLVHEGWHRNAGGRALGPLIRVAHEVSGDFDVIFGGHTHREFTGIVGSTLVIQTTSRGQMYGRTQVCIDTQTGRVIGAVHDNVTRHHLRGLAPDVDTDALVTSYAARRDEHLTRTVGSIATVQSHGGEPPIERVGDFALGNFVADIVRSAYGTDLALLNAGAFRDGLPASTFRPKSSSGARPDISGPGPFPIALGDLTSAFGTNKNVVTTAISGAALWELLDRALDNYPRNPDFLHVSGLRVAFDPRRSPGERIVAITDTAGRPIPRNDRLLSVAALGYMVLGNSARAQLFDRTRMVVHRPYLDTILDEFQRDAQQGRVTVIPPPDGRVRAVTAQGS